MVAPCWNQATLNLIRAQCGVSVHLGDSSPVPASGPRAGPTEDRLGPSEGGPGRCLKGQHL